MACKYLQYGCGNCAPKTWLNFDASPTLRLERAPILGKLYTRNRQRFPKNVRYGNIVTGLPVTHNSCDAIYCSHVLEHLSLQDLRSALRNTFEYLRPSGIFRMVVPDLRSLAQDYCASGDADAALRFMRASCLGKETRARKLWDFLKEWLGNSTHLWMWDFQAMVVELKTAGFVKIRQAQFNDSEIPAFRDVEEMGRFKDALAVEARKPDPAGSE